MKIFHESFIEKELSEFVFFLSMREKYPDLLTACMLIHMRAQWF
jgi:hypothetical protein